MQIDVEKAVERKVGVELVRLGLHDLSRGLAGFREDAGIAEIHALKEAFTQAKVLIERGLEKLAEGGVSEELLPVVLKGNKRRIMELFIQNPRVRFCQVDIVRKLGADKGSVCRTIAELKQRGLLVADGRYIRVHPEKSPEQLLIDMQKGQPDAPATTGKV